MESYKKILKEILKFRFYFFVSMTCGVVMSLAEAQLPINVKPLLNALTDGDTSKVKQTGIMVLGFFVLSLVARYFHMFYNQYMSDCVSVELRRRLHSKFLHLNLSYQNQQESGSSTLLSRILNDVGQVEYGIGLFADFCREPVKLIYLLAYLFYLDWKLTCMALFVMPVIILFLRKIGKSLNKYSHRSQNQLEGLTNVIKESLDGARVIQSFNLESEMQKRFNTIADRYLAARKMIQSRTELSGPIVEAMAALMLIGLFVYMGSQISQGRATIGDFGSFVAALFMAQQPIKKLQDSYVKFQRTVASADRVFAILETGAEVEEKPNARPFPADWQKIEYKNVDFGYGTKLVLRNFNQTIHKGEVVAFVGESGSGKSTVVNLLSRFFDPTQGQILVDGVDLREFKLNEVRKNVGLVTQDVFLFNETIAYNIQSGNFDRPGSDIESAAQSANAHPFIMARNDNYQTRVGDRGGMLSGGERQRVSIARAFLKDAPILILDEATSALDSASEVEVQKGLEKLMQGRTVLVIAHRLSTVVRANKIIVMRDGEVVEAGTHQSLIEKQGEYFRFRQLQVT